jgi:ribonuclease Z
MVDHLLAAWSADIEIRQGVEGLPERGVAVKVTEVDADGVVYDDEGLTVRAFGVPHGTWPHALGYRIDAGGRSVVISGDTAYSEAVAEACSGCDVLVHEVYSKEAFDAAGSKSFHAYHGTFHTSGPDVGRVATLAEAKQVVLYHQLFFGDSEQGLVEEVQSTYDGPVLSGRDLQRL